MSQPPAFGSMRHSRESRFSRPSLSEAGQARRTTRCVGSMGPQQIRGIAMSAEVGRTVRRAEAFSYIETLERPTSRDPDRCQRFLETGRTAREESPSLSRKATMSANSIGPADRLFEREARVVDP